MNPIPTSVSSNLWDICYDSKLLDIQIKKLMIYKKEHAEEFELEAKLVKKGFFEPVSDEGVKELIG